VAAAIGTASYLGPLAPFESFRTGAAAKDTIFGWTSVAGLHAAELSDSGFGGPASSLDGEFGFCRTTAERYDMDRVFRDLGTRFEILHTGIKPYACCRQHHTAVDAVLDLRQRFGLTAAEVDRVTLRTFVVASRGSNATPSSVPAAKYSAPYTIAVTCLFGRAWRDQYTATLIQDRDILDLASRVEVKPDAELEALYDEKWASIVEVRTRDGRALTARRDLPAGEPEHPLSDGELKTKFLSLACDALPVEHAEAVWDAIFALDDMDNVSALTGLLRSGTAQAAALR
jgi:2-methylcitrate dehydratase PrpD